MGTTGLAPVVFLRLLFQKSLTMLLFIKRITHYLFLISTLRKLDIPDSYNKLPFNMKLLKLTLSILALGLASSAAADLGLKGHSDRNYVYVNPHGNVGFIQDVKLEGADVTGDAKLKADHNYSYGYGLEVGVAGPWGMSAWRLAGEFTAVKAKIDHFASGDTKVENELDSHRAFQMWSINLYYDMMLSDAFDLNLGLGLGVANHQYEGFKIATPAIEDGGRKFTQFAWKLIAGLTYWPHEKIGVNARYSFAWSPSLSLGTADAEWKNLMLHTFTFGLLFKIDV